MVLFVEPASRVTPKTLRKIAEKRKRRAIAFIDRAHELTLTPERLKEDVMLYRDAEGRPRSAVLDHSRVTESR